MTQIVYKDIYKIYQLMEFFVVKHGFNNVMIKGLASKNEIWLANDTNPLYNIIRLSISSLDDTFNDASRIDDYLDVISKVLKQEPRFLDIHVSNEEVSTLEKYDTVCIDSYFYSGVEIEDAFPGIKHVVHEVDNPEVEIAERVSSVNSSLKLRSKQKREMKKMKLHLSCTTVLIGLCVLNFLLYLFLSFNYDSIASYVVMGADYKFFTLGLKQYWRLFTYAFCHSGLLHLVMNMYSLYILGNYYEQRFGSKKFILIIISGILCGGLVQGVFTGTTNNISIGFSGAIYSLFVIYIIEALENGAYNDKRFMFVLLLNLGLNFMSNVAWQAHLGGAIVGLMYYYMFKNDKVDIKLAILLVVVFGALIYKFITIKQITPIYIQTDQYIIDIYSKLGLKSYSQKLYQSIYNYLITH